MTSSTKTVLSYIGFLAVCVGLGGLLLSSIRRGAATQEPDPRHWLTEELKEKAGKSRTKPFPRFVRTDTDGEKIDIEAEVSKKPVFLIFIMDSCPCSYEAQPFFQRLYTAYHDQIEFIGVTDGTTTQAKEWKAHFQMVYPVISEPKKELMHQFQAIHSAYTTLLTKDSGIVSLWPGYSVDQLKSIDEAMAKITGKSSSVDWSDAPKKPTTGCVF